MTFWCGDKCREGRSAFTPEGHIGPTCSVMDVWGHKNNLKNKFVKNNLRKKNILMLLLKIFT